MKTCQCGCGKEVNKRFVSGHNSKLRPQEFYDKIGLTNRKLSLNIYSSIHSRIVKIFGKAKRCDNCNNNANKYEWCNLDKKYSLNRENWTQLCTSCHHRYDEGKIKIKGLTITERGGIPCIYATSDDIKNLWKRRKELYGENGSIKNLSESSRKAWVTKRKRYGLLGRKNIQYKRRVRWDYQ